MSIIRSEHEQQPFLVARIDLAHDHDGRVWLSIHPPQGCKVALDGKRRKSLDFPLPSELAAAIGRSLIKEATKATRQGQAGAH